MKHSLMKTLLVIITHASTASAFMQAVQNINIKIDSAFMLTYDIHNNDEPETTSNIILSEIKDKIGTEHSALFITDLIGSTPYNIAKKAKEHFQKLSNNQATLLTGLNLPILLKLLTYQHLPANELAKKAHAFSGDCITIED